MQAARASRKKQKVDRIFIAVMTRFLGDLINV